MTSSRFCVGGKGVGAHSPVHQLHVHGPGTGAPSASASARQELVLSSRLMYLYTACSAGAVLSPTPEDSTSYSGSRASAQPNIFSNAVCDRVAEFTHTHDSEKWCCSKGVASFA